VCVREREVKRSSYVYVGYAPKKNGKSKKELIMETVIQIYIK